LNAVCEDVWPPDNLLTPHRANKGMGPVGHDRVAFFEAKIVNTFADRAANIFVKHEHEITLK
jgi:hypothetical protein